MEEVQTTDTSPVRLAFRTSYLGDRFFGSQVQAEERTVEGEFIAACRRLELFSDPREARFLAAGRTDRGVHARGQVYALSTSYPERAITALPWQLPRDIWVTGYAMVDPEFHPRYRAISRTYRYYYGYSDLDLSSMDDAAGEFIGCHDFTGFARIEGKDPFRTILASRVFDDAGLPCFEVTAESFLWHMVRYMAAALLLVGKGIWNAGAIENRLEGEQSFALRLVPPDGLILWDADCGIPFEPVSQTGRSGPFIRELAVHHTVMARICRILHE